MFTYSFHALVYQSRCTNIPYKDVITYNVTYIALALVNMMATMMFESPQMKSFYLLALHNTVGYISLAPR